MDITVFYATNRAHEGADRFQPTRYGSRFSSDGMENLRFGRVSFSAEAPRVQALHHKMMQVDCSVLVSGLTQHSYYANGRVARDIRLALQGLAPDHPARALLRSAGAPNQWRM